jgi:hypothetical protein
MRDSELLEVEVVGEESELLSLQEDWSVCNSLLLKGFRSRSLGYFKFFEFLSSRCISTIASFSKAISVSYFSSFLPRNREHLFKPRYGLLS